MVHHADQALTRHTAGTAGRLPGLMAALTVAAIALIVSACGGGSDGQSQSGQGPDVGASIELADCGDWNQASDDERMGTIRELKAFAGGPVVGSGASSASGRGAVLDDQQAYDLFQNYCKQSFAAGFKLYKLYERAAAFAGRPAQ